MLEDVQGRGGAGSHHSSATRCRADPETLPIGQMDSSNKGLLRSTSRAASLYRNFKEREAELQQQLLSCQNEQVKLIGLVGLLIIDVQALQQKGTVASSPAPSQEALHSVVWRLLQDLGKTAAVNNSLQHSFLTANSSLSRTMGSTSPSDKNLDKCRQKEAAGATTEQVAALRQEKEWLLSEMAMMKKLQEDAVTEVRLCVPEAWWWDDFWQAW
ncbi:uncharacterized protein LOC134534309 [Bacillus rossius redtenbacheri]|uniref:uncharacterized protein LOC134534309 n=1 Tax=Bacillus rossius redtenbacheri TaxID=93214 RepID=UPI002FDDFF6C